MVGRRIAQYWLSLNSPSERCSQSRVSRDTMSCMTTYRVAQLHRGTGGWTVTRSIPGEPDEQLGHYLERAEAQSAWERFISADAKKPDKGQE
jgi:hypothetical protein